MRYRSDGKCLLWCAEAAPSPSEMEGEEEVEEEKVVVVVLLLLAEGCLRRELRRSGEGWKAKAEEAKK